MTNDNGQMTNLDKADEALRRSERAGVFAQTRHWKAAAADMKWVGETAIEVGQTRHAAQAMVMQGNLLANESTSWLDAAVAYENGALLYEQVGEGTLAAQAWRQVAAVAVWREDGETATSTSDLGRRSVPAVSILQHAISLLDTEADADLMAQLYETISRLSWAEGDFEEAAQILKRAQAEMGDSPEIDDLQQRQAILQGIMSGTLPMAQAWEMALPMLEPLGVLDESLMEGIRAYNEERWGDVVRETAVSRQNARDDEDEMGVLRYVIASLLMADAQDKQGNRVSVLMALLTCRAVLMEELGEAAAVAVDNVLNSLAERWGQDGLQTALAGYENYVAVNGRVVA